jgi:hypothetical protein
LNYERKFFCPSRRTVSPIRQKFALLNLKRNFDDQRFCSVSATIGINRFDSAHPTDNVAICSPAENTVRLAIALEADEEWPLTVTPSRAAIAAFRGAQRNEWVPIG